MSHGQERSKKGRIYFWVFAGGKMPNIALKRDGRYRARPLALLQGLP